jgi:hypothetical protein
LVGGDTGATGATGATGFGAQGATGATGPPGVCDASDCSIMVQENGVDSGHLQTINYNSNANCIELITDSGTVIIPLGTGPTPAPKELPGYPFPPIDKNKRLLGVNQKLSSGLSNNLFSFSRGARPTSSSNRWSSST